MSQTGSRQEKRFQYATRLTLRLDSGEVITGHTVDVSLSGAFLETNDIPPGISLGDSGVAMVPVTERGHTFDMAFACSVARITPKGIALFFDEGEEHEPLGAAGLVLEGGEE